MASQVPIARQVDWVATIPQFAVLAGFIAVSMWWLGRDSGGLLYGPMAYLACSYGSRGLIAREHREGTNRVKRGDFAGALTHFQRSYEFFSRHSWIDRYRSIVLLSSSAWSYREMALANIALCYSQLGRGADAKAAYERVLAEFPNSTLATPALRLIEAAEAAKRPVSP